MNRSKRLKKTSRQYLNDNSNSQSRSIAGLLREFFVKEIHVLCRYTLMETFITGMDAYKRNLRLSHKCGSHFGCKIGNDILSK